MISARNNAMAEKRFEGKQMHGQSNVRFTPSFTIGSNPECIGRHHFLIVRMYYFANPFKPLKSIFRFWYICTYAGESADFRE